MYLQTSWPKILIQTQYEFYNWNKNVIQEIN